MDFNALRREYTARSLDENDVADNPFIQFEKWMKEALDSGIADANAMTLATVSEKGFASARMVLLKDVSDEGFTFFTNYESRKGRHLGAQPSAALLFFWKELERQVRIEGDVQPVAAGISDTYFMSRPPESRLSAVISPQSRKIKNRGHLEALAAEYKKEHADGPVGRPAYWGGYILIPKYLEFWQGRENRLHDRIVYCRFEKDWKISRLAP